MRASSDHDSVNVSRMPKAGPATHDGDAKFQALFNAIDQGFCIVEVIFDEQSRPVDYVFLEVNHAFEGKTGLADAVGKRVRDLIPVHEAHWFEAYGRVALTGKPERFEHQAVALGRWFDVYAFPVEAPERHHVALLFDDKTSHREAETALRESEARYRMIFEAINEGFVIGELVRDAAGRVCDFRYLEVAPSFQAVMGIAPEVVIGRTVNEVLGSLDEEWMEVFRKVGEGVAMRAEHRTSALDKWFQASFTPLGNDRVAILFSDVTEQKRREQELKEARAKADAANISKSKFLAAASHDLRQPIQSLILFTHVLTAKLAGHPAQMVVGKMSTALDTFKDLLDSLLDLSKLDAGLVTPDARPQSVAAVLHDLVEAYQARLTERGLRFKTRLGGEWAEVDATLLRRIVSNLLDNALKYTQAGGVVLTCRKMGDRVRIDVIDTGVGIQAQYLDDIFTEFVQVGEAGRERTQGMGLGLATVKRLADLLGYGVSVRSRSGRGSRFSITVPLAAASDEMAGAEGEDHDDAQLCRVLVVDDDWAIVEGLKALFEVSGYEVLTAGGADEALALLAGDDPPDAIVADYRLGGAVTGIGLIEEARRRAGRFVPGLVMTGDTDVHSRPDLVVLHKPVAPDLLKKTLAEICG